MPLTLAQRLERAEAAANAAFVEARAQVSPEIGATWIDVGGTYALFDGVSSPLTQTFGLGLFAPCTESDLLQIESFFRDRGANTLHEVSAHSPSPTQQLLESRGYRVVEESLVWIRSTADAQIAVEGPITVREVAAADRERWAQLAAAGWRSEGEELAAFVEAFGSISAQARGTRCFVALLDDAPIAAGAMSILGDIALLAGASTIPTARRRGAQSALLQARLAFAAAHGVELAMVVTLPSGASRRNAERRGFALAYGRTKWERPL